MALPTNKNIASKYAINISKDGPIAIYDILPDVAAMQDPGGSAYYVNQVYPNPPHPTQFDSEPTRWVWFDIPSTHTVYDSSAYFIMSRQNGQAEWPDVSGLPMLYGGTNRTRYSLLNRDVSMSEPPLPFLQVPSFGFGQNYEDRARTIEFWMETDPYPHPVNMNMFDDQTSIFSPEMTLAEHYTLVGTGFELNPVAVTPPNADCGVITLDNTKITFIKDQPILAAKRMYTLAFTARNDGAGPFKTVTASIKLTQARIDGPDLVKTYTDEFQVYSPSGEWTTFTMQFVANEAMTFPTAEVSLETDAAIQITQLGLWAGSGGVWQVPGVDVGSDVEFFSTAMPTEIVSVGGVNGAAVTLFADAGYLYLRSVDKIDSYYMGQWGRQMYVVMVDEGANYSVYINAERVMSVPRVETAETGLKGEFILFHISPLFKYIDISTIAVYPYQLPVDIMKLHYVFGGGPKYVDVLSRMSHERAYVADGSAVNFSGHALFPQSHKFSNGTSYGVDVNNNTLTLPDYQLPPLLNAEYKDMIYTVSGLDEYSLLYFQLPEESFMQLSPKRDIAPDINYVFIDIASLIADNSPGNNTKKICRIEAPSIKDYVIDFYINIDLLTDGDFEDSEFNRDFATTEKTGTIEGHIVDNIGSTTFFTKAIVQADFSLAFNIDALQQDENYLVSMLFSDKNLRFVFDEQAKLKSISCCTKENVAVSGILYEGEDDIDAIQVDGHFDDFGVDTRGLLQKATYSIYPNVDIIDGNDVIFLDIAANGFWRVNIPLTNLAEFVNGVPDLDFVLYSDSERLPQIVAGLNTNRFSYNELATYIDERTKFWLNRNKYDAAQTLFDGTPNDEVGLEVTSIIPALGRFANPNVQTYVTLDSRSRFPFKEYTSLKVSKATTSMYIDFENDVDSILDTKWEIFNEFAMRMPKVANLARYELSYAVHLRSPSLTLQKPVVRRADFFGVASGTSAANSVTAGNGSRIYVGNSGSYGTDVPYSLHIPTETFSSMYMPKSFGFYPHYGSGPADYGDIVYQLADDKSVKALSFYMLWRGETFPNNEVLYPGFLDNLGYIKYVNGSDVVVKNNINIQSDLTLLKITGTIKFGSVGPTVYVDGVLNGKLYVNKWQLIQINFNEANTNAVFVHTNTNLVTNFVCSSIKDTDPIQLYASRTGASNIFMTTADEPAIPDAEGRFIIRSFNTSTFPHSFDL